MDVFALIQWEHQSKYNSIGIKLKMDIFQSQTVIRGGGSPRCIIGNSQYLIKILKNISSNHQKYLFKLLKIIKLSNRFVMHQISKWITCCVEFNKYFCHTPHICQRHHKLCLWRKILLCGANFWLNAKSVVLAGQNCLF